ncbi:hypothetical protein [Vibrio diabolicus]|uniref:Uncharacterized protein n=1 Tax=Vibrio diabolicus TaxID=50719 RepID=A0AAX1XFU3_9VIBR|nr:hypothetical protein [Vibrio diabolicus]MCS0345473.1 hypothetical protein [Vibrio diabolicus]MCS0360751.1 hypothetical protein [Vibrio diabolicus]MCS0372986.1 hypothetical protein [Vibrio diabolicus]MCS0378672.1 hypothetical protein [Vibrio diabolicus]MCS0424211.1 hypothetical protein [Vibrio diabolicus]
MRKLKIDTYSCETGELEDSLSIPLGLAKVIANVLPENISSRLDENGEQLEALVNAVKDAKTEGILLELEDTSGNERLVFSVL